MLDNSRMSEAIIIDPAENNRVSLNHQLGLLGNYHIHQYADFKQMRLNYPVLENYKGLIFLTLAEGADTVSAFVQEVRIKNPDACVILLTSGATLDEVKISVQLGMDQILTRPFSSQQLQEKITAAENFRAQVKSEALLAPNNTKFEAKVSSITDKFYRVSLSGWLTETYHLPEIEPVEKESTLFIKCDRLRGMNSVGIRMWLVWLKVLTTKGFIRFEFEDVLPSVLQQASMVQGFIPENGSVNSFYLTYFCETNNSEKDFKFVRGKDFSTTKMRVPKTREDVVQGQTLIYELDSVTSKLLKFFKGSIDIV